VVEIGASFRSLRYARAVSKEPPVSDHAIAGGVCLLVLSRADEPWQGWLAESEIRPLMLRDHAELMSRVDSGVVDAILIDAPQLDSELRDLIARLRKSHGDVPVLVVSPQGGFAPTSDNGLRVLDMPLSDEVLVHEVRAALHLSYSSEDADGWSSGPESPLLGRSPAMQRVRDLIARAAPGLATILIRGETGTGKELVARAIHAASERAAGPLITIHCAALPDTLLESELFGHAKGAFTGAVAAKPGRVALAAGGTLLLDEIGDITPATQTKLLRLLQEREYQPLGSNETLRADVRFLAATHRDLDAMVKEGTFRQDLFYRLQVVPIWVPPLRARGTDVQELAESFCAFFAEQNNRVGTRLGSSALERLQRARWPGNVRQLQNFVERLVVLGSGGTIEAADVERELSDASPFTTHADATATLSVASYRHSDAVVSLDEAVRLAERRAIVSALKAARGNRSQAARLLGVSRATLYNKLKEHALP
jgi:DNA-binding NtrC family response regulator